MKMIVAALALIFGIVPFAPAATAKAMAGKADSPSGFGQKARVMHVVANRGVEPGKYLRGGQLVGYDIDIGMEPALVQDVPKAIRAIRDMRRDGALDRLNAKWF